MEELQDIGMHDGGGIHLTKEEIKQAHQERYEQLVLQQEMQQEKDIEQQLGSHVQEEPAVEDFYPIRCQCSVSCQERYNFYPGW